VHLLPYMEQSALYQRFKLDEPWDSPNNKPLSQLVIKAFTVPGRPAAKPWETYWRGFVGPKDVKPEHRPWLLEGQTKGPAFPAIFTDGTSNTILVAEAEESLPPRSDRREEPPPPHLGRGRRSGSDTGSLNRHSGVCRWFLAAQPLLGGPGLY